MDPLTECRRILSRANSNFAPAFALLPPEQRDAMTAFYAFCRLVDDAVDRADDPASAGTAVREWKDRVERICRGGAAEPVDRALSAAVERFGIRKEHLLLVLAGVESDLVAARHETFADLYEYCYRVASAVGLVCVTILGLRTAEAETYAELTGIAVQLTNIIRDVAEDARNGRIYLPMEDLRAFGVAETDLLGGIMKPGMKNLLRFEAARASEFYALSDAALPRGARRRLFFAEALKDIYRRLLDRMRSNDFAGFGSRASINKREKAAIVLKHRLSPAAFVESFL
jgi:phytoene synthase